MQFVCRIKGLTWCYMNDIFASLRQGAPAVPTKKRDEMRRIIMDATMKLINERDVCDIKPSDIMKITGLSRAAFFFAHL